MTVLATPNLQVPDEALVDAIVARAGRPDFGRFAAQLRSSGYCERPVRLRGWGRELRRAWRQPAGLAHGH